MALESKADILLYGGAAGGGKTDLLIGAASTQHQRTIIFRREHPQFSAMIDRMHEVFGDRGEFNQQKMRWTLDTGAIIELGSVPHEKDKRKYQGRPHDLIGFDETTQFTQSIFDYLRIWNRSSDRSQRCRVICASNPPLDADGRWTTFYWAPWLYKKHPNPAIPGELRYFVTTEDGRNVEVDGPDPVMMDGQRREPVSRTFIPARVSDNPTYAGSDYERDLMALPPVMRRAFYYGDWDAGSSDDINQLIPTEWVELAQARQGNKSDWPYSGAGIDIARGGMDQTVIVNCFGPVLDWPIRIDGEKTPDGQTVLRHMEKGVPDYNAIVVMDAAGVGSGAVDVVKEYYPNLKQILHSHKSLRYDKTGRFKFRNRRAEIWWRFMEALDPDNGDDLCLPDDPRLLADLTAPTVKMGVRGIQIEEKSEIIKRLGFSPDVGEATIYAWLTKDYSREKRSAWGT